MRFWKPQRLAWPYVWKTVRPAVFMEMRLGKTLLTIRRCNMYRPRDPRMGLRVLMLGPSSVLEGWMTTLADEGTAAVAAIGERKRRQATLALAWSATGHPCWVLANKEAWLSIPEIGTMPWDAVVLDESTFVKNPKAGVTKWCLKNFRTVRHRWILTGTPVTEGVEDLWCQFAFLDGTAFGARTFWQWRAESFLQNGYEWMPKVETRKQIETEVARRALVMRRRDVGLDVPKVSETRKLEFPSQIRAMYREVENEFALEGRETIWAMQQYVWLRQLCGGVVEGKLVWRGKIDELLDLLRGELRGEQVVVWFMYNDELRVALREVANASIACDYLMGDIPIEERMRRIKRFRAGAARIMLCQQAVAQEGVDLSCADTAIYYSEPPGMKAYCQTEDRVVKLGKKGVLILHLVVKGSVDEDLRVAQAAKKWNAKRTLDHALREAIKRRQGR